MTDQLRDFLDRGRRAQATVDAMLPRQSRRTSETAGEHAKRAFEAAKHALRSYQYGNAATDLAKQVADECEDALLHLAEFEGGTSEAL
jgi:hypothetical protein